MRPSRVTLRAAGARETGAAISPVWAVGCAGKEISLAFKLGMTVRVIDLEPFGRTSGIETRIGGEERQNWDLGADFEGRRELYRVVTPQTVGSRQASGPVHQRCRNLDDQILVNKTVLVSRK
jgi:hypothetical protein